jgi:hypothetical protein
MKIVALDLGKFNSVACTTRQRMARIVFRRSKANPLRYTIYYWPAKPNVW